MKLGSVSDAFYAVLRAVFWFGLVLGGLGLALSSFGPGRAYVPTKIPHQAVSELPPGSIVFDVVADVPVARDTSKNVLHFAGEFVRLAFSLLVLWLLLRLARSVRMGDAFTRRNVSSLRWLGWVLLLGEPMVRTAIYFIHRELLSVSRGPYTDFNVRDVFSLGGVFVALAVFVLAQIFAQATALREDVEATV